MKIKTLTYLVLLTFLLACSETAEQKKTNSKLEELKCRAEFSKFLLENTMNTQLLLEEKGYKDELEEFRGIQADTLVSCDSIKSAWETLSSKALK